VAISKLNGTIPKGKEFLKNKLIKEKKIHDSHADRIKR
jgi:hypothetical protein